MDQPDEFLKRAAECERMIKSSRDPQSKDAWRRMAERWHRCAKVATSANLAAAVAAAHHGSNRHRKPDPVGPVIRGSAGQKPMTGWYLSKAEECLRQAKEATNSRIRSKLETEGGQWRDMAAEIEKIETKGHRATATATAA